MVVVVVGREAKGVRPGVALPSVFRTAATSAASEVDGWAVVVLAPVVMDGVVII